MSPSFFIFLFILFFYFIFQNFSFESFDQFKADENLYLFFSFHESAPFQNFTFMALVSCFT